jgi:hypothetical protein
MVPFEANNHHGGSKKSFRGIRFQTNGHWVMLPVFLFHETAKGVGF